jgi:hypothetical protein
MMTGLPELAARAATAERAGRVLVRIARPAAIGGRHYLAGALVEIAAADFARFNAEAGAVPAGPLATPPGGRVGPQARAPGAVLCLADHRRRVDATAPPRRPSARRTW